MKYIALSLIVLAIGCSTVDIDQKLNEVGITRPESQNFLKGLGALDASCKQSDSTSIQVCQFFKEQTGYISDMGRFFKTSLSTPDSLTGVERSVFNNITLVGAAYREYMEARQANIDSQRFWNSFAAGAAVGTLFSPPTTPPPVNCQIYGSGNYHWGQCQ
jgi:hypothetical protein